MTTLKEIAAESGVSIRTVRRVLNDDAHVKPDKVERVKEVLENINYVPNLFARGLRNKKTGIIGVIVGDLGIEVHVKKLSAIQRELMSSGYGTMLGMAAGNADIENKLIQEYVHLCDGIIFLTDSSTLQLSVINQLTSPYVMADSYYETSHAISIDRESGICDAIAEQSKNYQHLFFITHTIFEKEQRKLSFEKGAHAVGISDYEIVDCTNDYFNGGVAAAKTVIGKRNSLSICYNDRIAAGLLKGLYDAGCDVPGDYGVVGFDNDDFTQYAQKSVSTVTQSVDDLAKKTVALLELQINGDKPKKVAPVNTKFISRETTKEIV